MGGEVTEKLCVIYQQAHDEGIWLYEIAPHKEGGRYMAAAGSIEQLEELLGKPAGDIELYDDLCLGDIIHISIPGSGLTREEACSDAVQEFKKYQNEKKGAT